jgi:hypothetical protein
MVVSYQTSGPPPNASSGEHTAADDCGSGDPRLLQHPGAIDRQTHLALMSSRPKRKRRKFFLAATITITSICRLPARPARQRDRGLGMVAGRIRPRCEAARPPGEERQAERASVARRRDPRPARTGAGNSPTAPSCSPPSAAARSRRMRSTGWSSGLAPVPPSPFPVHAHMLRHACGYALANAATTRGGLRIGSAIDRSSTRRAARN